ALAALSGLVTGALAGCGGNPTTSGKGRADTAKSAASGTGSGEKLSQLPEDHHVCRDIEPRSIIGNPRGRTIHGNANSSARRDYARARRPARHADGTRSR